MANALDEILTELATIKEIISKPATATPQDEIITRTKLMEKLGLSEPTIIRLEKRGTIPVIHLGGLVRYNWASVVKALENPKNKK